MANFCAHKYYREMYKDKDGQLKPAPKGLALTPEQWTLLAAAMPHIDAALVHTRPSQSLGPVLSPWPCLVQRTLSRDCIMTCSHMGFSRQQALILSS